MTKEYSTNAKATYKRLYLNGNETIDECHARVVEYIADTQHEYEMFKHMLDEQIFRINTPCMTNAGVKNNPCLAACFILGLEDSMESIIDMWGTCARIYEGGGGAGIPITNLRAEGSPISSGGFASGPLSYTRVIQSISEQVKSGGRSRRAANQIAFREDHPDVYKLITCKEDGVSFDAMNLSQLTTHDFMDQKNVDGSRQYNQWHSILDQAYLRGGPGLLFYDRINIDNPFPYRGDIVCSNPCFTGDTEVWTIYGPRKFKDLARIGKNIPVLSQNKEGKIEVQMMRNPRRSHVAKQELVRVYLDNDMFLDCTPDHKWYVRTPEGLKEVEAQHLKEGDSLSSLYRWKANQHNRKRLSNGIEEPLQHHVHVAWKYGRRPEYPLEHCHHIDEDPTNDDPVNLEILSAKEHNALNMYGEKNPMFGVWDERNPLYKDDFNGPNNPRYYHNIPTELLLDLQKKGYSVKQICKELNVSGNFVYKRLKNNHKVVRIERLIEKEYVYNGTVDKNHNYFVHLGVDDAVLVKNCGEVLGRPWTSCILGHLNLNYFMDDNNNFDFPLFQDYIKYGVLFLNKVIDKSYWPHPMFEKVMEETRPIGLGIMGLADVLYKMEIPYGSKEALNFVDSVTGFLTTTAFNESMNLAKIGHIPTIEFRGIEERKAFSEYISQFTTEFKEDSVIGNSTVTTIAPTGSTALSADCSYGMEPEMALIWNKLLSDSGETWPMFNRIFVQKCEERGIVLDEAMKESIQANHGSIQHLDSIPEDIKKVFVVAHDIHWKDRINMQSSAQTNITMSISSTVNLPNWATRDDIEEIYEYAYKSGLKGITVFRDGSIDDQPVNFGGMQEGVIDLEPVRNTNRPSVRSGKTIEAKTPDGALYITGNAWDGSLKEVFFSLSRQDSRTNHLLNSFGRVLSKSLQYGVPLDVLLDSMRGGGGEVFFLKLPDRVQSFKVSGIIDAAAYLIDDQFIPDPEVTELDCTDPDFIPKPEIDQDSSKCPECGKLTFRRDVGCRGGSCMNPLCLFSNCM